MTAQNRAHTALLAAAAYRHVAVGRRIDPGGRAGERDVAGAGEDLAAHRVALPEVVQRHQEAVEERQVDALPSAGALPGNAGRRRC